MWNIFIFGPGLTLIWCRVTIALCYSKNKFGLWIRKCWVSYFRRKQRLFSTVMTLILFPRATDCVLST